MRTKMYLGLVCLLVGGSMARCQGTFVYDQQSSTNEVTTGFDPNIQSSEPIGQSFTPALSSVGFVRMYVSDSVFPIGAPATVYVNLLSGSITGAVLGATSPLSLPGGYFGYTSFLFPASVTVVPGTTYYFQLVAESSEDWITRLVPVSNFNGTLYLNGQPYGNGNLAMWFREGIVVPEPSLELVAIVVGSCFMFVGRGTKPSIQAEENVGNDKR